MSRLLDENNLNTFNVKQKLLASVSHYSTKLIGNNNSYKH